MFHWLNVGALGCGQDGNTRAVDGGGDCEASAGCGGVGSRTRWRDEASLTQVVNTRYPRGAWGCGCMSYRRRVKERGGGGVGERERDETERGEGEEGRENAHTCTMVVTF